MAQQLIIVSRSDERLQVHIGTGVVDAVRAPGDDVTHVVVEPAHAQAAPAAPVIVPRLPPPPPDITMGVVSGRPALQDLVNLGERFGRLSFHDIAEALGALAGRSGVLFLSPGDE